MAENNFFRGINIFVIVLAAYFAGIAVWYLLSPVYISGCESNITAVSYLASLGKPVYSPISGPEIYSFPYGPLLYIVNGAIMTVMGASIQVSKIGGAASGLLNVFFAYIFLAKKIGKKALPYLGFLIAGYLVYPQYAFGVRADPFILLLTSLALNLVFIGNEFIAVIMFGILAGAAFDFKINSALYFLPFLTIIFARYGFFKTLLAALIAAAAGSVPFWAFKNISLGNYYDIVHLNSAIGISGVYLISNVIYAVVFVLLPLAVFIAANNISASGVKERLIGSTEKLYYLLCFAGALILTIIIAGKNGAGPHHILPFIMLSWVLLDKTNNVEAVVPGRNRAVILLVVLAISASALFRQREFLSYFIDQNRTAGSVVNDLRQILIEHKDQKIEAGYGGESPMTNFKPLIVFSQKRFFLNDVSLGILRENGLPVPELTDNLIKSGDIAVFLIPAGMTPFAGLNGFSTAYQMNATIDRMPLGIKKYFGMILKPFDRNEEQVFDSRFRKIFFGHYKLTGKTRYFDIWEYKRSVHN